MKALNVMTVARHRWFHLGVVAIGIMLLAWVATLGLVRPVQVHLPEASHEMASALVAARQHYEDHKLTEVERRELWRYPAGAPSAAQARYEDFKLRQVEGLLEGASARTRSAAQARYEDFKLRQIEP